MSIITTDLLSTRAAGLFDELDWPTPEDEAWRRTPLQRLVPKGALDSASSIGRRRYSGVLEEEILPPDGLAARIVTQGGVPISIAVSEAASSSGLSVEWAEGDGSPPALTAAGRAELQDGVDRVTAWHWRDMPGSVMIRVPRGAVITDPVMVEEHCGSASVPDDSPAVPRVPHLHIEAAELSAVEVVWSIEGEPVHSGLPVVNAGLSADAAEGSRVGLTVRQNLGKRSVLFLHQRLVADSDGRIDCRESHLGGVLVKTRTRAVLTGEGSEVRLKGLFVAREGRHMDIGSVQEHRAPRTLSDALYKGAVKPGGRSAYTGLIEVAPGAVKTDAYLTNRNLVLGDGARADSLPQLNILTDDVKCSHGSATGKPDEDQLFYLRSRGFSPDEARMELTRGFLNEAIDGVPPSIRTLLAEDLDSALADG